MQPCKRLWRRPNGIGPYLEACAREGGRAPAGEALARFFPWALDGVDHAAWREAPSGAVP